MKIIPATCAWNLWSSSAALRTHPSDTRCSCSPCQTAAYPSQRRWRWWCTVRRSGWTRPPLCSSWWWGYRWEISKTWLVWTLGAVWRISTWRDQTLLRLTILPTTKRRSENQNNSNHPESEKNDESEKIPQCLRFRRQKELFVQKIYERQQKQICSEFKTNFVLSSIGCMESFIERTQKFI